MALWGVGALGEPAAVAVRDVLAVGLGDDLAATVPAAVELRAGRRAVLVVLRERPLPGIDVVVLEDLRALGGLADCGPAVGCNHVVGTFFNARVVFGHAVSLSETADRRGAINTEAIFRNADRPERPVCPYTIVYVTSTYSLLYIHSTVSTTCCNDSIQYMAQSVTRQMTDQRRALLTEREREILTGEADVTDNYRYSVESRIRSRLKDRLSEDVDVIREYYPEMYDDAVYPIVCQPGAATEREGGESGDLERREPADDPAVEEDNEPDSDPLEARMEDVLESFDVTGRGAETQEVRRKAIRHAWEKLRDRGEATTQELANSAFDEYGDHPKFDYDESSSHYRGYTFWDSCAREVMKELPGVEAPPQRGNTWRLVGGENE